MPFKDTLSAMMKSKDLSKEDVSKMMTVSNAMVYRYLEGSAQPKWDKVLLLLEALGYELKMTKKKGPV